MEKRTREEKVIAGLQDAIDHAEGKKTAGQEFKVVVPEINVREIREELGLTQTVFAIRFGFPVATVRNWEQGRRKPEGAARLLLEVIQRHPDMVEEALQSAI